MHDSRVIKIVIFTTAAALSAGTLMASAGTPYRLVPVHFYPCIYGNRHNVQGRECEIEMGLCWTVVWSAMVDVATSTA